MGGPLPVAIGLVGGPGFGGESRRGLGMEPWGCGVGKSALGPLPGGSGWWSGKGTPSRDDKHTRRGRGCPSITPTRRLLTMGSGSKRPRVPRGGSRTPLSPSAALLPWRHCVSEVAPSTAEGHGYRLPLALRFNLRSRRSSTTHWFRRQGSKSPLPMHLPGHHFGQFGRVKHPTHTSPDGDSRAPDQLHFAFGNP